MALFTDGPIATLDDLRRYDSAVLDVVSAEGIDIEAKIEIAQREIGLEITSFLVRNGVVRRELTNVIVTSLFFMQFASERSDLLYRDAYKPAQRPLSAASGKSMCDRRYALLDIALELASARITPPVYQSDSTDLRHRYRRRFQILPIRSSCLATEQQRTWDKERCGCRDCAIGHTVASLHRYDVCTMETDGCLRGTSSDDLKRQNLSPIPAGVAWTQELQQLRTDLADAAEQEVTSFVTDRRRLGRG